MTTARTQWVIGNWKLNPARATAQHLFDAISAPCVSATTPRVMLAVPAPYLVWLAQRQGVAVAAQDVSTVADYGAYTGEYHARLLADAGIQAVIIGHSERRELFGETKPSLQAKVKNALDAGLQVIFCVGEKLEQREQGNAVAVVLQQLNELCQVVHPAQWSNIIIAYEPVWAIGTGQTASDADAQAMHQAIRQYLTRQHIQAGNCAILYGGSVKPDNAASFAACPDIDGALVGGASLAADSFLSIVRAFG